MRKKLLNSIGIFVMSIILTAVIWPIGIIYTLVNIIRRIFYPKPNRPMVKVIWYISSLLYGTAKGIDQLWNTVCRDLFNDLLIKKGGHRFGDVRETISSVLWKNEETKTLTGLWEWLVKLLDSIEKDHCKKSIIYIIKKRKWHNENEHWLE